MIALSEHRLIRIVVLCALYVAQGVPYGFLTVTLAAALVEGGLDAGEIGGIFALGTLPWAFKWVWGPFVDRFGNSRFGRRRPWILAAQAGTVRVGEDRVSGRYVVIDHGHGVRTSYCHLDRIGVTKGQQVKPGDRIGLSGNTGRSTGPHLHFVVRIGRETVDPERLRRAKRRGEPSG
mgnify:CR=1 FL=1